MDAAPVFASLKDRSGWREIRRYFLEGGVVGFPAEYAYALAEVPTKRPPGETRRLTRIKGRPEGKSVLYLAGSLRIVARFAKLPKDPAKNRLMTGPSRFLTILLPATPLALALGMAKSGKVAFRIPPDRTLREFLVFLGEPLSGTSLNPSGSPPLTTREAIHKIFPDLAVVDGGFRPGAPVSPILDPYSREKRVLRGSWRQAERFFKN